MEGLTQVEDWFVTFMNKGQVDVQELYEKVQIIGNILPRLYVNWYNKIRDSWVGTCW